MSTRKVYAVEWLTVRQPIVGHPNRLDVRRAYAFENKADRDAWISRSTAKHWNQFGFREAVKRTDLTQAEINDSEFNLPL